MENENNTLPIEPQGDNGAPNNTPELQPKSGFNKKKIAGALLVLVLIAVVGYFGKNAFFKGSFIDLKDAKYTYNPSNAEEFFDKRGMIDVTQVRINDADKTTSPFGDQLVMNTMKAIDSSYFSGAIAQFVDDAFLKDSDGDQTEIDTKLKAIYELMWDNLPVEVVAANNAEKQPLLVAKSNAGKLKNLFSRIESINGAGSVTEIIYRSPTSGAANVFEVLSEDAPATDQKTLKRFFVLDANGVNIFDPKVTDKKIIVDAQKLSEPAMTIQWDPNDTLPPAQLVVSLSNGGESYNTQIDPAVGKKVYTNEDLLKVFKACTSCVTPGNFTMAANFFYTGVPIINFNFVVEEVPVVNENGKSESDSVFTDTAGMQSAVQILDEAGNSLYGQESASIEIDSKNPEGTAFQIKWDTTKPGDMFGINIFNDLDSTGKRIAFGAPIIDGSKTFTNAEILALVEGEGVSKDLRITVLYLKENIPSSKPLFTTVKVNILAVKTVPVEETTATDPVKKPVRPVVEETTTTDPVEKPVRPVVEETVDTTTTTQVETTQVANEVDTKLIIFDAYDKYLAPNAYVLSSANNTRPSFKIYSPFLKKGRGASVEPLAVEIQFSSDANFTSFWNFDVNPYLVGNTETMVLTSGIVAELATNPNTLVKEADNFYFRLAKTGRAGTEAGGTSEIYTLKAVTGANMDRGFPYTFSVKGLANGVYNLDVDASNLDATATVFNFALPKNLAPENVDQLSLKAYSSVNGQAFGGELGTLINLTGLTPERLSAGEFRVTNAQYAAALRTWATVYNLPIGETFYVNLVMTDKDGKEYAASNYQPIVAKVVNGQNTPETGGETPVATYEVAAIRAFCAGASEETKLCFVQYNDYLLVGKSVLIEKAIEFANRSKGQSLANILSHPSYSKIVSETGFTHMSEVAETNLISYLPTRLGAKAFTARGYLLPDTTFYLTASLPKSSILAATDDSAKRDTIFRYIRDAFFETHRMELVTNFLNNYKYVEKGAFESSDPFAILKVILRTDNISTKRLDTVEDLLTYTAKPVDSGNGGEGEGEGEGNGGNTGGGGGNGGNTGGSGGGGNSGGSSGGSGGGNGGNTGGSSGGNSGGSTGGSGGGSKNPNNTAGGSVSAELRKHILAGAPQVSLECLEDAEKETIFQDIHKDNPAYKAINFLAGTASLATSKSINEPILVGYPLTAKLVNLRIFKANNEITRAEFLKLALVTNCIYDVKGEVKAPKQFPDAIGHWASNIIDLSYINGYINGYVNGDFGPNDSVTRAQALKILLAIKGQALFDYDDKAYADIDAKDWYSQIVTTAYKEGLLKNIEDFQGDEFEPNTPITRAESAMLIKNMYDYILSAEEITAQEA